MARLRPLCATCERPGKPLSVEKLTAVDVVWHCPAGHMNVTRIVHHEHGPTTTTVPA